MDNFYLKVTARSLIPDKLFSVDIGYKSFYADLNFRKKNWLLSL